MNSSIPDGQDGPDGDRDHTTESPSLTLSNCHSEGVPGNQNQARGGLNYVPNMEMALPFSAGPRSDLLAAMENADRATGPDPMRIPSELCGGESRLDMLKRKAAHILR